MRAKDTGGKAVAGATDPGDPEQRLYSSNSISNEVTVVSIPMADLTIDTKDNWYSATTRRLHKAESSIAPLPLQPNGYSSAGISASGEWKTDIDVSSFPQGTTWTIDSTPLTPENGVLKAVTGSGDKTLKYVIPAEALPKEGSSPRSTRSSSSLSRLLQARGPRQHPRSRERACALSDLHLHP